MYKLFKNILRNTLPKRFIYKIEPFLRYFVYLNYKGKKFECNICSSKLAKFIARGNDDFICPRCGSIGRNRSFWYLFSNDYLTKGLKILDFSPSRALFRKFKKISCITYLASDISGDFISDVNYNITKIEANDDFFDIIICYHILEHIEEDHLAMAELNRILKKGGTCFIQTPFKDGEIFEDFEITSPTERLKYYGQEDHVRIYSADGLKNRLELVGFSVEFYSEIASESSRMKFPKDEIILICRKK